MGSVLVFSRGLLNPFALPKATLVVVIALASTALTAVQVATGARFVVRDRTAFVLLAGVAGAFCLTTSLSDLPGLSFVGQYGRWSGLVAYGSYAALGAVAATAFDDRWTKRLLHSLVGAGLVVIVYALLQRIGADPFSWETRSTRAVFSTVGSSNFLAAIAGLLVPLGLWQAYEPGHAKAIRLVGATLALGAGTVVVFAGAAQGYVVALLSTTVFATAVLAPRVKSLVGGRRTRAVLFGLAAVTAGALGLFAGTSLVEEFTDVGTEQRLFLWRASIGIFADHPVVGTGLGTFANHSARYLPAEFHLRFPQEIADAPHSVPLGMFANGGALLGGLYLAFIVLIAVRLVSAFRARGDVERRLVAAVGAVWLGYQVQSLVSIDDPSIAWVNWVFAGIVLAFGRFGEWRARPRRSRTSGPAALVAAGVATLVLLIPITRPLRADAAAMDAQRAAGRDGVEAIVALDRATSLTPREPRYHFFRGQALGRAVPHEALASFVRAAEHGAGQPFYAMEAARYADRSGEFEVAEFWYEQAQARSPNDPRIALEFAEFHSRRGSAVRARELACRAVFLGLGSEVEDAFPDLAC